MLGTLSIFLLLYYLQTTNCRRHKNTKSVDAWEWEELRPAPLGDMLIALPDRPVENNDSTLCQKSRPKIENKDGSDRNGSKGCCSRRDAEKADERPKPQKSGRYQLGAEEFAGPSGAPCSAASASHSGQLSLPSQREGIMLMASRFRWVGEYTKRGALLLSVACFCS